MAEMITGKVAAIENNYSVVINRGKNHQVRKGMTFVIEDPKGMEIPDPDEPTQILGYLPVEKIRVKVFDVQDKFCRAETYVHVQPETPYEVAARELLADYKKTRAFPNLTAFAYPAPSERESHAKLQQILNLLQISASNGVKDERPAVVEVNVGDIARQVG